MEPDARGVLVEAMLLLQGAIFPGFRLSFSHGPCSASGLVTWGSTALIIGWLTGFFGLFGLPSAARRKLPETSAFKRGPTKGSAEQNEVLRGEFRRMCASPMIFHR